MDFFDPRQPVSTLPGRLLMIVSEDPISSLGTTFFCLEWGSRSRQVAQADLPEAPARRKRGSRPEPHRCAVLERAALAGGERLNQPAELNPWAPKLSNPARHLKALAGEAFSVENAGQVTSWGRMSGNHRAAMSISPE